MARAGKQNRLRAANIEQEPGGLDDPEDETPGVPGEISAENPAAIRGPNGIWNEESLPVLDWEDAAYRVVVPITLQQALQLPLPVIRWSRNKLIRTRIEHPEFFALGVSMTSFLATWQLAGPQPDTQDVLNVFVPHGDVVFLVVIGADKTGGWNLVTVFPGRRAYIDKRVSRGGDKWVRRK